MDIESLQQHIDRCIHARDMIAIAGAYLSGRPVYDRVAAEAWLNKAIDTGDPVYGPRAMGLLARQILGKAPIVSDQEIVALESALKTARGKEKTELEELLSLV